MFIRLDFKYHMWYNYPAFVKLYKIFTKELGEYVKIIAGGFLDFY